MSAVQLHRLKLQTLSAEHTLIHCRLISLTVCGLREGFTKQVFVKMHAKDSDSASNITHTMHSKTASANNANSEAITGIRF